MYKKLITSTNIFIILALVFILNCIQIIIYSLIDNFTNNIGIIFFFTYLICIVLFIIMFKNDFKEDLNTLKNQTKNKVINLTLFFILFTSLTLISNTIIYNHLNILPANESLTREAINSSPFFMLVSVCILGPITEEIIYRLPFKKVKKHRLLIYILYSLLFALMHIVTSTSISQLLYLIPYFFLSLNFGYGLYKTNNIFVSIIIHSLYNLFNIMLILVM